MSETALYGPMQVAASRAGARLFRNHVGVAWQRVSGGEYKPFRIGLATGSGDLIGWTPVTITTEMVGRTLAVFTSVEAKLPPWHPTPAWERSEQGLWLKAVRAAGGIACVATTPAECAAGLRL